MARRGAGKAFCHISGHGYEVHALSLRGHGNSEGRDKIKWMSANEYVADVKQVIQGLSQPPILIGHSMAAT
jgi:pimeloyl-ACP methyl ester carboxylesterase